MKTCEFRTPLAVVVLSFLAATVTATPWFSHKAPRSLLQQPPSQAPAAAAPAPAEASSSPAQAPGPTERTSNLPFILLHGLGDSCEDDLYTRVSLQISRELQGRQGYCLEIGNGKKDSWLLAMMTQVEMVCNKVKADPTLSMGFNLIGFSQGALIGRGYIEFCGDGPKVQTFVSLGGPQAGVASFPGCDRNVVDDILDVRCIALNALSSRLVYEPDIQQLAPAQYLKIPGAYDTYLNSSLFLPVINNERPWQRDPMLKERFTELSHLILVEFEQDRVLVPVETAQFGFYPPYNGITVLPVNQTQLYIEDWIGLRELDEQGKVTYVSTPGQHLNVTIQLINDVIAPAIE